MPPFDARSSSAFRPMTSIHFPLPEVQNRSVVYSDPPYDMVTFAKYGVSLRLTKVEIPDGLETLEATAFSGCTSLTRVTIPASVTKIGRDAFVNCPHLTIRAPAGSYAEQYAKEHSIPFQAL